MLIFGDKIPRFRPGVFIFRSWVSNLRLQTETEKSMSHSTGSHTVF
jgi:hypothetical protein